MRDLTAGEQAFVVEYLRNGRNASAAYRAGFPRATDASARAAATRLLRRAAVRRVLAEAEARGRTAFERELGRYELTKERVAQRLVAMSFTDLDQIAKVIPVLDERGGVIGQQVLLKDLSDIPPEARAAIAEISTDGKGRVSLKLVDRRACLLDIARLKGWITDNPSDTRQVTVLKIER